LNNINQLFTDITGKEEGMRSRLRSAKQTSLGTRKTPTFLRIIASPDDEQGNRLNAQSQGDVATLKWDAVVNCIGESATNKIKEGTPSIHL
jgi:hypothetical protein